MRVKRYYKFQFIELFCVDIEIGATCQKSKHHICDAWIFYCKQTTDYVGGAEKALAMSI